MSAHIKFSNGEIRNWWIGYKPPFRRDEIYQISTVQCDDHEADFMYHIGMSFNNQYVHQLNDNEAKLYCLLILAMYTQNGSNTVNNSNISVGGDFKVGNG